MKNGFARIRWPLALGIFSPASLIVGRFQTYGESQSAVAGIAVDVFEIDFFVLDAFPTGIVFEFIRQCCFHGQTVFFCHGNSVGCQCEISDVGASFHVVDNAVKRGDVINLLWTMLLGELFGLVLKALIKIVAASRQKAVIISNIFFIIA